MDGSVHYPGEILQGAMKTPEWNKHPGGTALILSVHRQPHQADLHL